MTYNSSTSKRVIYKNMTDLVGYIVSCSLYGMTARISSIVYVRPVKGHPESDPLRNRKVPSIAQVASRLD